MFVDFRDKVNAQIETMVKNEFVFRSLVDNNKLWELYLSSFPEGTNPIYKERSEHDCQCCKQFVFNCGDMVTIKNGKLVTIWDSNNYPYPYDIVAKVLSAYIKKQGIENQFLSVESLIGNKQTNQLLENNKVKTWNHFYFKLPSKLVVSNNDIGTKLGESRTNKEVFKRSLEEITLESIEIVLELIEQNSIYRGVEHKSIIKTLLEYKKEYDLIKTDKNKDIFCWEISSKLGGVSKFRNTVIGSLLVDISEGKSLDIAVKSFESKVAPTNYKRPTAVVTKGMIDQAEKTITELGLTSALKRRYAVTTDLTINNVLFADRTAKKEMSAFDELRSEVTNKPKSMDKVEEVDIETFIDTILPKVSKVELFIENKFSNNFVSLIAPTDINAAPILKWNNNFSWSYNGEVTDSIKEKVKNAGGNVDGVLRCSLGWYNGDDLDIHIIEPNNNEIYFSNKSSYTSGQLDVDMNAGCAQSRSAVENITWTNKNKMLEGNYKLIVHNYSKRETIDTGFNVEIEYEGNLYEFSSNSSPKNGERITIVQFTFSKSEGIKIDKSTHMSTSTKNIWGINTQQFVNVNLVMNSPNHWDDNKVGNKHYFFVLDNCKNPDDTRGLYNEFLKEDLDKHRKVFEMLGSKLKADYSNNQVSGLGFSSTQKNEVLCKVTGSFNRTIKLIF